MAKRNKVYVCVCLPRLVVLGMPIFILIESSFSNTIYPTRYLIVRLLLNFEEVEL